MADNKRHDKRKATQRQQEAASGKTLAPRGLARSVAKYLGHGKVQDNWRDQVMRLPKYGRKYLHPELHRKVERV